MNEGVAVAVAGATGTVGRHVVRALETAGHRPVAMARSTGVDVTTGRGLAAALEGVTAVVDVTNVVTMRSKASVAFFRAATEQLMAFGARAGVRHHVALSIVGCDRVDLGYYVGKRCQEELVLAGPVPGTVLRATQFFEFAERFLAPTPLRVQVVPRMRTQPIAAQEVAAALVDVAVGSPLGLAPELAGPREEQMVDLARRLKAARGSRGLLLPLRVPGRVGRGLAGGGLLPTTPGPRGRQTFDAWLAEDQVP